MTSSLLEQELIKTGEELKQARTTIAKKDNVIQELKQDLNDASRNLQNVLSLSAEDLKVLKESIAKQEWSSDAMRQAFSPGTPRSSSTGNMIQLAALQQEVGDLKKVNDSLTEQLQDARTSLSALEEKSKMEKLKSTDNRLRKRDDEAEVNRLKRRLQERDQEIETLKVELSISSKSKPSPPSLSKRKSTDYMHLDGNELKLAVEIENTKKVIAGKEKELVLMRSSNRGSFRNVERIGRENNLVNDINRQKHMLKEKEKLFESLQEKKRTGVKGVDKNLKDENELLKREIIQLKHQIRELKGQVEEDQEDTERLLRELEHHVPGVTYEKGASFKERITQIEDSIDQLNFTSLKERDSLEQKVDELQKSLEWEREDKKEKLRAKDEDIQAVENEKQHRVTRMKKELQDDHSNMQFKINELKEQLERDHNKEEGKIRQLERDLEIRGRDLHEAREKENHAKIELNQQKRLLDEEKEETSTLTKKTATLQSELDSTRKDLVELKRSSEDEQRNMETKYEARLAAITKDLDLAKFDLGEFKTRAEVSGQQLAETKRLRQFAEDELRRANQRVDGLQSELDYVRGRANQVDSQTEALEKLRYEVIEKDRRIHDKERQIEQLRREQKEQGLELSDHQERLKDREQEINALQTQNRLANEKLNGLQTRITEMTAYEKQMQRDIKDLQSRLADAEMDASVAHRVQVDTMTKEMIRLRETDKLLHQQLHEMRLRETGLEEKVLSSQVKMSERETHNGIMQTEMDRYVYGGVKQLAHVVDAYMESRMKHEIDQLRANYQVMFEEKEATIHELQKRSKGNMVEMNRKFVEKVNYIEQEKEDLAEEIHLLRGELKGMERKLIDKEIQLQNFIRDVQAQTSI